MEQIERLRSILLEKLHILDELAANTERQSRFLRKRQMTGLQRLLRERAELLRKLAALKDVLSNALLWKDRSDLAAVFQSLAARQKDIHERSKQVLREARFEQNRIAAELKQSKVKRKVNQQYALYAALSPGRNINEKA